MNEYKVLIYTSFVGQNNINSLNCLYTLVVYNAEKNRSLKK